MAASSQPLALYGLSALKLSGCRLAASVLLPLTSYAFSSHIGAADLGRTQFCTEDTTVHLAAGRIALIRAA